MKSARGHQWPAHETACGRKPIVYANGPMYLAPTMAPGIVWQTHLWTELKRSGIVLVVVSPNAAVSSWVRDEVECAVNLQRAGPSIAIIPLILDSNASPDKIHPALAKYQYADFTHPGLHRRYVGCQDTPWS